MDEKNFFTQISQELRKVRTASQVNTRIRGAIEWYTKKVAKSAPKRVQWNMLAKGRRTIQSFTPGQMITFRYRAKGFDEGTLPYYDAAPLVIILGENKHGNLLGLNLHYLPPPVRAKILAIIMKPIKAKKLRHDTRLRITYAAVQSIAQLKPLQFAIKSYIPNNIGSKIIRIQPVEWHHAVFLPTSQFIGASKRKVWASSK